MCQMPTTQPRQHGFGLGGDYTPGPMSTVQANEQTHEQYRAASNERQVAPILRVCSFLAK